MQLWKTKNIIKVRFGGAHAQVHKKLLMSNFTHNFIRISTHIGSVQILKPNFITGNGQKSWNEIKCSIIKLQS